MSTLLAGRDCRHYITASCPGGLGEPVRGVSTQAPQATKGTRQIPAAGGAPFTHDNRRYIPSASSAPRDRHGKGRQRSNAAATTSARGGGGRQRGEGEMRAGQKEIGY